MRYSLAQLVACSLGVIEFIIGAIRCPLSSLEFKRLHTRLKVMGSVTACGVVDVHL